MTLIETILKQQAFIEKTYPKSLQEFLKIRSKINNHIPGALYSNLKPITSVTTVDLYLKSLSKIDSANKFYTRSAGLAETIAKSGLFSSLIYNLDAAGKDKREKEVYIESSKRVKAIITDIYSDHSELLKLEPRTFEELIAELLFNEGFKVEITQQTRDNGYDIIAIQDIGNGHIPLKFLVECKRYKSMKVGVDIVRSFKEVIDTEQANKNVKHPNLFVASILPNDLSPYDFIFLDSVTKLGLTPDDLNSLKRQNPSKSFIYIFQSTKEGNFRGANAFQHDVDVVIQVPEKGIAVQKGRFNQGGEIDIFDSSFIAV